MTENPATNSDREATAGDDAHGQRATPHRYGHWTPTAEPKSVQQIAPPILAAYTVDGGHAHLLGCHLEDVPVVRISPREETPAQDPQVGTTTAVSGKGSRYFVFDAESHSGREADAELIESLHLDDLEDSKRPGTIAPERVEEVVTQTLCKLGIASEDEANWQIDVIWCKQVDGKLEFAIGNAAAEQYFSGWAASLTAPAYHCNECDFDTFHLAATSDGRVVAAEKLETCATSGETLPATELVECTATRRRVATHLTTRCPASGLPVQTDWMVRCSMCQQLVSPATLDRGRCACCRKLQAVAMDDARVAAIIGRYPELNRWPRLAVSESETATILQAAGLWQKRLLVVERVSGQLVHAARGRRLSDQWQPIEDLETGLDL